MKLRLQFGLVEPARVVNWWQTIKDFPLLVLFKGKKWEFVMYNEDKTNQVEYICYFSEIANNHPLWHHTGYQSIDNLLITGYGPKCECGAAYTSFPDAHMFFCPRWSKW